MYYTILLATEQKYGDLLILQGVRMSVERSACQAGLPGRAHGRTELPAAVPRRPARPPPAAPAAPRSRAPHTWTTIDQSNLHFIL